MLKTFYAYASFLGSYWKHYIYNEWIFELGILESQIADFFAIPIYDFKISELVAVAWQWPDFSNVHFMFFPAWSMQG